MNQFFTAIIAATIALFFTSCHATDTHKAQSTQPTPLALIKGLYSKSLAKFEIPQDKAEAIEACEYIKSIFFANLIKHKKSDCEVKGDIFVRFPTLASEDLEGVDPNASAFSHSIREGETMGGVTAIQVITPTGSELRKGKVVYFVESTSAGVKIVNFLSYTSYPLDLTGDYKDCVTRSVYFKFALPPKSELEIADLPSTCRALTRKEFGIGAPNR